MCSCYFIQHIASPVSEHVATLLEIRPCHVHIRWHKKYAALFGGDQNESLTNELRNHQSNYDHQLIIN